MSGTPDVLRVSDTGRVALQSLLSSYGLKIVAVADGETIPGSHWGDDEAGLIGCSLYARNDTPVHSVLHEACHWLVMNNARRLSLHTDAGGTSAEENAVCYLQVLLADCLPGVGRDRLFSDMDLWGYSFRLGSSKRWFEEDAEEVLQALPDYCRYAEGLARALNIT